MRRGFKSEAERQVRRLPFASDWAARRRNRYRSTPSPATSTPGSCRRTSWCRSSVCTSCNGCRATRSRRQPSGVGDGRWVIAYNPLHSPGRTRSNQAHELAHIALGHTPRTVETVGELSFVTCDVEQEGADWLGGCLLLPRPLLLQAAFQGKSGAQIAEEYETSEPMARFGLNASGVLVQVARARAARGRRRSAGS